jgi:hypothetical protein
MKKAYFYSLITFLTFIVSWTDIKAASVSGFLINSPLINGKVAMTTDGNTTINFTVNFVRTTSEYPTFLVKLVSDNGNFDNKDLTSIIQINSTEFGTGTTLSKTYSRDVAISNTYYPNATAVLLQYSINGNDWVFSTNAYQVQFCEPVTVSPSVVICPGSSTTLTASGADSYTWSPAEGLNTTTGATVVATPSVTTIYNVVGNKTNGCSSTKSDTVILWPFNISPDVTTCYGSPVKLVAKGPGVPGFVRTTYSWSPSDGLNTTTNDTVIANPSVTTTYTVTMKFLTCTITKSVTVTVAGVCGTSMEYPINLGTIRPCDMLSLSGNTTGFGNNYGSDKTNGQPSPDVFYKFKGSGIGSGNYSISTCSGSYSGADFDTYLHLLYHSGQSIQSNNDACGSNTSEINVNLPGASFYIVVEGNNSSSGNYNLLLSRGGSCLRSGSDLSESESYNMEIKTQLVPNPATADDFRLVLANGLQKAANVAIYDSKGALKKSIKNYDYDTPITTNDLENGIYFVTIIDEFNTETKKLVVNK